MLRADHIRNYPLFQNLSEAELAEMASLLVKRAFAKNVYLYYPDNPSLNVYLVESGLVRLFFTNLHGKEFIVDLAGPQSLVGLPVLHDHQKRMIGATALLSSTLLVLSRESLTHFVQHSPSFNEKYAIPQKSLLRAGLSL
jgi:CRP-like cAMP-binding protein